MAKAQCCELDAGSSEGVQLGMRGKRNKISILVGSILEFQLQTPFVQANAAACMQMLLLLPC